MEAKERPRHQLAAARSELQGEGLGQLVRKDLLALTATSTPCFLPATTAGLN